MRGHDRIGGRHPGHRQGVRFVRAQLFVCADVFLVDSKDEGSDRRGCVGTWRRVGRDAGFGLGTTFHDVGQCEQMVEGSVESKLQGLRDAAFAGVGKTNGECWGKNGRGTGGPTFNVGRKGEQCQCAGRVGGGVGGGGKWIATPGSSAC